MKLQSIIKLSLLGYLSSIVPKRAVANSVDRACTGTKNSLEITRFECDEGMDFDYYTDTCEKHKLKTPASELYVPYDWNEYDNTDHPSYKEIVDSLNFYKSYLPPNSTLIEFPNMITIDRFIQKISKFESTKPSVTALITNSRKVTLSTHSKILDIKNTTWFIESAKAFNITIFKNEDDITKDNFYKWIDELVFHLKIKDYVNYQMFLGAITGVRYEDQLPWGILCGISLMNDLNHILTDDEKNKAIKSIINLETSRWFLSRTKIMDSIIEKTGETEDEYKSRFEDTSSSIVLDIDRKGANSDEFKLLKEYLGEVLDSYKVTCFGTSKNHQIYHFSFGDSIFN